MERRRQEVQQTALSMLATIEKVGLQMRPVDFNALLERKIEQIERHTASAGTLLLTEGPCLLKPHARSEYGLEAQTASVR